MRGLLALLAGVGLFGGASAGQAASGPPPAAWVRYAELAGRTFPAWLEESTPAAGRLRDYFDGVRAERGGGDVILPINVWVAPDGKVTRVTAPVFAQAEANADLEQVLTGRSLSEPPPPGLRLPMRLRLRIAAPAPASPPAARVAEAGGGRP